MKSGKKIIVTIICLIVLLLMVGAAFAYVYIQTDVLKTDKEIFFKYFTQIVSEDDFIDKRIQEFNNKKKQNPYENSGEITVEVEAPEDSNNELLEKVNDLSIIYSGKVDSQNKKVEKSIKVDYGEDVTFPVTYRQNGNNLGIQIEKISKQFIAIRNENLEDLIGNVVSETSLDDIDVTDINELVNTIPFTEEEENQIKQIYVNVINEQLLDEYFSKVKNDNSVNYTLELSYEQIKNILIKILEASKENPIIIDKINEIILTQDPESQMLELSMIDDLIKTINEDNNTNIPNIKITLVEINKQLKQIIFECGEIRIIFEKNENTENLKYNFKFEIAKKADESESSSIFEENVSAPENVNIYFGVEYTGLNDLVDVQEKCEFGCEISDGEETTIGYNYKINSSTKFVDSVSIEEIDKEDAVFLNDYEGEQIKTFFANIVTKILEINKTQMEQLGLKEYENPLLYTNPVSIVLISSFNMFDTTINSIQNVDLSDYEIQTYNGKFEKYVGEDVDYSSVNGLINTIKTNN